MTSTNRRLGVLLIAAVLCGGAFSACGEDDDDVMETGDGDGDGKGDGGDGGEADGGDGNGDGGEGDGGDGSDDTCPAPADRTLVNVENDITANAEWTCDNIYALGKTVFVKSGATLKIAAGTIVQGDSEGALIVTNEGKLDAVGTAEAPIVFTSFQKVGERKRGDWKGLVLLGKADINHPTNQEVEFEGLTDLPEYRFGGTDDEHDCGKLKYARIEFAGFIINTDKELNALSLAGCGSKTEIDYVQVHRGNDDGVEIFGGTVSVKHIVFTGGDDDALDWDLGWRGNAQFLAIQQPDAADGTNANNGFEGDNFSGTPLATPASSPTIFNVTMIGANAGSKAYGLTLKNGGEGTLKNSIIQGFPVAAIDVQGTELASNFGDDKFVIANTLFYQSGAAGTAYWQTESGDADDDAGFVEADHFTKAAYANVFDSDPKLAAPYNYKAPGFVPAADSPAAAAASAAANPGGWFDAAPYLGAFEPGGDDWTAGWTAYPEN